VDSLYREMDEMLKEYMQTDYELGEAKETIKALTASLKKATEPESSPGFAVMIGQGAIFSFSFTVVAILILLGAASISNTSESGFIALGIVVLINSVMGGFLLYRTRFKLTKFSFVLPDPQKFVYWAASFALIVWGLKTLFKIFGWFEA
jgi:hypothetical protein